MRCEGGGAEAPPPATVRLAFRPLRRGTLKWKILDFFAAILLNSRDIG